MSPTSLDGIRAQTAFLAERLSVKAVLDILRSSPAPLDALLDRIIEALDAGFAVYRDADGASSIPRPGAAILGRARGGREIRRAERLLPPAAIEPLLREAPAHPGGVRIDGSSSWRAAVPIRRRDPLQEETMAGVLLIGGPRSRLRPALAGDPALLAAVLAGIAPWIAAARLLQDESEPGDGGREPPLFHVNGCPGGGDPIDPEFPGIIAASAGMRDMLDVVARIAPTDAAILLEGESGTGKELIARAIHQKSRRGEGPFVSENCAACPPNLLESEFFGIERGAFTGAVISKPGILERAGGGTLFLDEIAELELPLQAKLLRVLQEREVRRVGGRSLIPVDFRLVSASNRNLDEAVSAQRFRPDLLYRLEVVKIRIPPLRERPDDIPHIATHFLRLHSERLERKPPSLHPAALALLTRYPWPGNVRELQNEMWRAVAYGFERLHPGHLSEKVRALDGGGLPPIREPEVWSFQEAEREILGAILRAAIRRCGGNCARAASLLGLPKTNFYRRIRRYGIRRDRIGEEGLQPIAAAIARYRFLDVRLDGRTAAAAAVTAAAAAAAQRRNSSSRSQVK